MAERPIEITDGRAKHDGPRPAARAFISREPEYLPAWYPALCRRRRVMMVQLWSALVIVVVMATMLILREHDVRGAEFSLRNIQSVLEETDEELNRLEQLAAERASLAQREKLIEELGLPVEVTRVLAEADAMMPSDMMLTRLEARAVRREVTLVDRARAKAERRPEPTGSHELQVVIEGITRTDDEVAALFERLSRQDLFERVRMVYGRDAELAGKQVRQFRIEFNVGLDLYESVPVIATVGGS